MEVVALQMMPDHLHGILFVKEEMPAGLGRLINGFKAGCNRAYREIEAAAQAADGITRACCIYNTGKKRIELFYTGEMEKRELTEALKQKLPQFMIPGKTVKLDEMPLNKNGKIDRHRLSELS